MTSSATDATGNPLGWTPVSNVSPASHDQVMPWVKTDSSRNIINIAYLSSEADLDGHLLQVMRTEIDPPATTPNGSFQTITPIPADPAADLFLAGGFIGDYIGLAVQGDGSNSRAYFGFTGELYEGIAMQVSNPEQNNLLSALDY